MKKVTLILLMLLGYVAASLAQGITDYQVKYYNQGASQPLQATDAFPASAAVCNQDAPPPTQSTVNPRRIIWDDTANAGKVCIFTVPTTGSLPSLPTPGSYEGTLSACNQGGCTESIRAPFSRLAAPPARTGVRIIQ